MKKIITILFVFLSAGLAAQVVSDETMKDTTDTYIIEGGNVRAVKHNQILTMLIEGKIHRDSLDNVQQISDTCLRIVYKGVVDTFCVSSGSVPAASLWDEDGDTIYNTNDDGIFVYALNKDNITNQLRLFVGNDTVNDEAVIKVPSLMQRRAAPEYIIYYDLTTGYLTWDYGDSTSHFTKTGNDIQNNNSGKVILPKDSTYFSGILDEATKVGRLVHQNQYGKLEWTSPLSAYQEMLDTAKESKLYGKENIIDVGALQEQYDDFSTAVAAAGAGDVIEVSNATLTETGTVTMPHASTLKIYEGGLLTGTFTLVGDSTRLDAGLYQCFGADVTITGTWIVDNTYAAWFGMDGVGNDGGALTDAIAFARLTESKKLVFEKKTYTIETDNNNIYDCKVYGNGATFNYTYVGANYLYGLTSQGDINSYDTIVGDVCTGEFEIIMPSGASALSLSRGDLLKIISDYPYDNTAYYQGEIVVIDTVIGTRIVLNSAFNDTYDSTQYPRVKWIEKYTPEVHDLTMKFSGRTSASGVSFMRTTNAIIDNVKVYNAADAGFYLADCWNTMITDCEAHNADNSSQGYGLQIMGASMNTYVDGLHVYKCKHAIATGSTSNHGVSWNSLIKNVTAYNTLSHSYDCHEQTGSMRFQNCSSYSGVVAADTANFKGVYDAAVTYDSLNIVQYNGMLFRSQVNSNVGNSPGDAAITYWFPYSNTLPGFRIRSDNTQLINCKTFNNAYGFQIGTGTLDTTRNVLVDGFEAYNTAALMVLNAQRVEDSRFINLFASNTVAKRRQWILSFTNCTLNKCQFGNISGENVAGVYLNTFTADRLSIESLNCTGQICEVASLSAALPLNIGNCFIHDDRTAGSYLFEVTSGTNQSMAIDIGNLYISNFGLTGFYINDPIASLTIGNAVVECTTAAYFIRTAKACTTLTVGTFTNTGATAASFCLTGNNITNAYVGRMAGSISTEFNGTPTNLYIGNNKDHDTYVPDLLYLNGTWSLSGETDFVVRDVSATANVVTVQDAAPANSLFIEATTGDVGIGTASPAYDLDIAGSANLTGSYYLDAGEIISGVTEGGLMEVSTANSYVNVNGKLSAGSLGMSPAYELTVNGDGYITDNFTAHDTVTMPDLPTGKQAKQVYIDENGLLYAGDTTGTAGFVGGGSSVEELNDLSDVTLTEPDSWDVLRLDDESMQWINVPLTSLPDSVMPGYWYLSGDTIRNKNQYIVRFDSSVYIYPLPPEATKMGRIMHINQYGKIEWVSPLKLYEEQLDNAAEMGTPSPYVMWGRDTTQGIIYTLNDTDIVRINNIKVIEVPNQSEFVGSIYFGNGGEACDTTRGVIDPIDPLPAESSGSLNAKQNTFVGINAGISNITGNYNLFVGGQAGRDNVNGAQNTFVGFDAGAYNVSGYHQGAFGCGALQKNNGYYNNVFGTDAMLNDTTGAQNCVFGAAAASNAKSIDRCTVFGTDALQNADTNIRVTAIGYAALKNYKGSNSTAIGYSSGINDTTGTYNTYIGYNATATVGGVTNSTAIGYSAGVSKSNQVTIGNSSVTETNLNGNVLINYGDLNLQGYNIDEVDTLNLGAKYLKYDGTAIRTNGSFMIPSTEYYYFGTTGYSIRGASNGIFFNAPSAFTFRKAGVDKYTMDGWNFYPASDLLTALGGGPTIRWGALWTRNITDTIGYSRFSTNVRFGLHSAYGEIYKNSNDIVLRNTIQDGDITIGVNAGGSSQIAITIDGATTGTTINGDLTVTGLDSASTDYGLYYDKATGLITYDSAGTGGGGDSNWDEAKYTLTTDYHVRVDSSFFMSYDNVYMGYHKYPAAPETGLLDGFRAGINFVDSSAFFASGYNPGDNNYINYMYSGYESFNELGGLSAFVITSYDADESKTSVLIASGDGGSNTSQIIITPDSVRIDSDKIILAGDLTALEDDPVWLSDSATYISKSQARSDINDSLVANSQGFLTALPASALEWSDTTASGGVGVATFGLVRDTAAAIRADFPAAGLANVVEDTSPQLGGNLDLNEFNVSHDEAPTADHTTSGNVITLTAGTNLVFGEVCYMGSDGKMEKGDADAVATAFCWTVCLATISENSTGLFALPGTIIRDDSWDWGTVGQPVYLDTATAGGLTQTPPTGTDDVVQIIGIATHADRIFFYPQLIQIELN